MKYLLSLSLVFLFSCTDSHLDDVRAQFNETKGMKFKNRPMNDLEKQCLKKNDFPSCLKVDKKSKFAVLSFERACRHQVYDGCVYKGLHQEVRNNILNAANSYLKGCHADHKDSCVLLYPLAKQLCYISRVVTYCSDIEKLKESFVKYLPDFEKEYHIYELLIKGNENYINALKGYDFARIEKNKDRIKNDPIPFLIEFLAKSPNKVFIKALLSSYQQGIHSKKSYRRLSSYINSLMLNHHIMAFEALSEMNLYEYNFFVFLDETKRERMKNFVNGSRLKSELKEKLLLSL